MTSFPMARATATAVLLVLPAVAQAETDLGFGTLRGYAEIEHIFNEDNDETAFNADLGFSSKPFAAGFGVDAAIRYLAIEDTRLDASYAALTYSTSFGKFSAGVPRPAIADMIRFPAIGGNRTLDLVLPITERTAEFAYLLGEVDAPLGLRYDGRYGNLSVGLSWHHFDEAGTDADVYDLVLRYDVGSLGVYAAVEHLDVSGLESGSDHFLGVEGDFSGGSAPIRAGLALFDRETFVFSGEVQGARGYVTYMPTDRIDVTGSFVTAEGNQIYGLDLA